MRDHVFRQIDVLLLPTMPTAYTVEQVLADPIELNSRLGTYTNFVNLLDLCGLAVPAGMRPDGMPFGVTLLAPAGTTRCSPRSARHFMPTPLCRWARTGYASRRSPLPRGARRRDRDRGRRRASVRHAAQRRIDPLGARFLETPRPRPTTAVRARRQASRQAGLLRVAQEGAAIELEIWALPAEGFGRFVAAMPPPLAIGTLRLADGRTVKGFLVEAEAIDGARDISQLRRLARVMAQASIRPRQRPDP